MLTDSKRNGKTIIIEMVYVSSICRNMPEVLQLIVPLCQRTFLRKLDRKSLSESQAVVFLRRCVSAIVK